jgi:hypothetical protein
MAFLDWVKNRGGQNTAPEHQPQQQQPETAKQMYTRQDAEQRVNAKPATQIPPDQRERVEAVKADLQKATQFQRQSSEAAAPAPQDSATSPQPMAQKATGQDKVAPDLSPTSAKDGVRPSDEKQVAPSETPARSETTQPSRPQTIARPAPSWER